MTTNPFRKAALIALLALALPATSAHWVGEVQAQDDDYEGWFTYVDFYVGEQQTQEAVRTGMVADINNATERIEAAFGALEDGEVVEALEAAAARGVQVRLVSDEGSASVSGISTLLANGEIDSVLGDGPLSYLPDPTLTTVLEFCQTNSSGDYIQCTSAGGQGNNENLVNRPDSFNVMTHSFVVIDTTTVWNITAPLTDEQPLWLAFRATSEDLARSFRREFNQMHAGVFSTTLSVYNGPLKSITQNVTLRNTNRGQMRVRFNPQERLVKNVIDEIYRAKGSVWVMTEDLQNRDLINALRYKQENGFDVRVMVGSTQGSSVDSELADLDVVRAPASMGLLPTFIVHDAERDVQGRRQPRLVQMLSHNLWQGAPMDVITRVPNDEVRIYPSDTFVDGAMWEILEDGTEPNDAVDPFVQAWESAWSEAQ
ncbi:hypothetical protein FRC96_15560 [Lujinxingia vulgaris]|uniref:phospholipase D n=1 Tax=Lujinxingia vulgaris TaxID=2600176 RepID=A0A5C6X0D8_9DELT|nr:hypothetical protein [Lujinxingia vulgaris]TXD33598.1 hypothetical protein FRC96_15560 [Lujinxingia vulgaris]